MATIVGNKIGTVINLLIDGDVIQKQCETPEQADALFKLVINAKKGGKADLDILMNEINRIHRIVVNGILETDSTGQYYLKGFNHPIPEILLNTFNEYIDNGYPINAIVNFWKLLMLNPDKKIRDGLFTFLSEYKFAITDNGYFTGYKVVQTFSEGIKDKDLIAFITEKFEKLKSWKKSPKNYVVLFNQATNKYMAVVKGDENLHDEFIIKGNLCDLYESITNNNAETIYTDKHNQTTRITLGKPVTKERRFEDHAAECSENGLHIGSTSYVNRFYSQGNTVFMVLVNPAHVIHIPKSETTKLRTAEYYPYAILEITNESRDNKFKVLTQPYFETDYANYEKERIEIDLALISNNEANFKDKSESSASYHKLLKERLVDLNVILGIV